MNLTNDRIVLLVHKFKQQEKYTDDCLLRVNECRFDGENGLVQFIAPAQLPINSIEFSKSNQIYSIKQVNQTFNQEKFITINAFVFL